MRFTHKLENSLQDAVSKLVDLPSWKEAFCHQDSLGLVPAIWNPFSDMLLRPHPTAQAGGSWFAGQGSNSCWVHAVGLLTTGRPGKSPGLMIWDWRLHVRIPDSSKAFLDRSSAKSLSWDIPWSSLSAKASHLCSTLKVHKVQPLWKLQGPNRSRSWWWSQTKNQDPSVSLRLQPQSVVWSPFWKYWSNLPWNDTSPEPLLLQQNRQVPTDLWLGVDKWNSLGTRGRSASCLPHLHYQASTTSVLGLIYLPVLTPSLILVGMCMFSSFWLHPPWLAGCQVSWSRSKPRCSEWKRPVLTTGLPGNSQCGCSETGAKPMRKLNAAGS